MEGELAVISALVFVALVMYLIATITGAVSAWMIDGENLAGALALLVAVACVQVTIVIFVIEPIVREMLK